MASNSCMTTKATHKISLKLIINKKVDKVVFAEAEKDFIDFLFNLLTLPIGAIVSFLPKENCLGDLHKSIKNLEQAYLQPNQNADSPRKLNTPANAIRPFFNPPATASFSTNSCFCSSSRDHVRALVTYMVTDDLSVTPMSMTATMALFKKYDIGEVDVLEEKVVAFGLDEALQLLKCALQSKAALTEVFQCALQSKATLSEVCQCALQSMEAPGVVCETKP